MGAVLARQTLGAYKKICRDCPEECYTKADRFGIDLPEDANSK